MRAATPPEEVNLRSHIAMEVDNEYEWMEEAGYKPVDGPLPVLFWNLVKTLVLRYNTSISTCTVN